MCFFQAKFYVEKCHLTAIEILLNDSDDEGLLFVGMFSWRSYCHFVCVSLCMCVCVCCHCCVRVAESKHSCYLGLILLDFYHLSI